MAEHVRVQRFDWATPKEAVRAGRWAPSRIDCVEGGEKRGEISSEAG